MVDVVHEPSDDEQAEMQIWPPADFCGFGLEHALPIHLIFLTLPIECKCRTMVECSQFITFASSRVHWRGSLWINVLKRSSSNPEGLPERGESLMPKRSSLNEETIFLPCSLRWHCPHTRRKCFWSPPLLSPLYCTQREEYVGNVPISPLDTSFCSVTVSIHYLQMTKFQYVNSCTTIDK